MPTISYSDDISSCPGFAIVDSFVTDLIQAAQTDYAPFGVDIIFGQGYVSDIF